MDNGVALCVWLQLGLKMRIKGLGDCKAEVKAIAVGAVEGSGCNRTTRQRTDATVWGSLE